MNRGVHVLRLLIHVSLTVLRLLSYRPCRSYACLKSLTRRFDVTHECKRFGKKQRKAPLKRTAFQRAFHVYSVNPLHSVSLGG